MSYKKQSVNEDEQFRLAAKAIIALRSEKLSGIAKALQLDPGGLSGWLGGTPNRLSLEKKEILSNYLGLEFTHISPSVVHYWNTNIEDLSEFAPVVINKDLLKKITVTPILADTITIGCIYHSKVGDTTLVILCRPQNKAFQIPILSPEITGWGNLSQPVEIKKCAFDSWWTEKNISPEYIWTNIHAGIK
ncbi:hypothetical protein HER14_16070 [Acidithiobacillus thiooxidans]|jgi:hypothetical protein|uniref:hypothetical protein n=1 Tax=Acidithiobacillus TaxID=119977 RepID=UPI001C06E8F0|nr:MULTISPECIES: hypothetical protein [Acidithiobacillus]MBU2752403.1 hypothetical protein [Acidithiobacillus thiooxidans]MBU2794009.1 hypothetical protein [Acidithiobacillus thiooxidans]MBU2835235.1 hypothetical protein [Acidithiobacillus thiooxidans]MBU2842812.1 hypothetical protein [Acidithiobacillus thiooxidans]MDD2749579.1 hypothetical protein [Acidithiobacillus sp.]